ncbi:hypothetical protein TNIN_276911 [Trichonephila inaurata madagascariensis]|uniref:Uncharacterized protein n=1 Tax=Trichonephila inaurata madagascariensis TaxID=2747483 RepID=A0A8X6YK50_9ARAC|nr:hypothetical protein TNIN_276911 [Trichonephila inaurata madagascariensis]
MKCEFGTDHVASAQEFIVVSIKTKVPIIGEHIFRHSLSVWHDTIPIFDDDSMLFNAVIMTVYSSSVPRRKTTDKRYDYLWNN